MSLGWVGLLLRAKGDNTEARPYLEQALALCEEVLGEEHPDTATSHNNVGDMLYSMADYSAARPHYERALSIRRKVLGEEHSYTARSVNSLAGSLEQLAAMHAEREEFDAARTARQEVLAIKTKLFGAKDWRVTDARLAVAHVERLARLDAAARRRLAEAEQLNGKVVQLYGQGKFREAVDPARRILDIRKEILGEEHPDTAQSLNNLGNLLQSMGDYAAAEPLVRQGLEIDRRNLELAFAAQSERQQLRMAESLRGSLDRYLSLAPRAEVGGVGAYRQMLIWKGAVFVRQRELRLARSQPELAGQFAELQSVSSRLATLAFAVPDPQAPGAPARAEARSRQIEDLTGRKEELERELSGRSVEFRTGRAATRRTPEEIQAALPRDTALIDFLEYTHYSPPQSREQGTGNREQGTAE